MSDLEELRDAYIEHTLGHKPCTSLDDWAGERFDAILAQRDRKIAAEALEEVLAAHRPSQWRSLSNDSLVLRCCGRDFGKPSGRIKPADEDKAHRDFEAHLAEALATHLRVNGGA